MTRTTRSDAGRPTRTVGLLAATTALALAVPATPVAAQQPSPPAAAASWLVDQLEDGTHLETSSSGEAFVNYGPTADVALALLATGQQPAVREDVVDFLTTRAAVDAYVHGDSDSETYAGATAKLGHLTTQVDRNPRAVGGEDLVATLQGLEADSGRYSDQSSFGDFSNTLGQSFGLLFLGGASETGPSDDAVQFLLDAQCDDGGFPQDVGTPTCESSVDATGLALQALADLATAPAPRQQAVDWLVGERDGDGAWTSDGQQNVNSTAYAGMGLRANGESVATTRQFLRDVQNDDGGLPISPGGDSDPIATAQALPLLAGTTLAADPGPTVGRVQGENRRQTAIEASRATFADGRAATVVLTRDDVFADALAGTPLAVSTSGPLLTTPPDGLADDVLAEIERVLPADSKVLVLGGPDALPRSVEGDLRDAGYDPVRIAGRTRFETSVAIARRLGTPPRVLLTTGLNFPDALTAGAAAAVTGGAVLLTDGDEPVDAVTDYVDEHSEDAIAVGGPAAAAYPEAEALVGTNREETATLVADRFFDDPATVGLARLDVFADALAGGALVARQGGPLLLTASGQLPDVTSQWLCDAAGLDRATVLGGPVAVGDDVVATVRDRLAGRGC